MPVPSWVAQINKRVFNKLEIKRGTRPVLTHVGRTSGQVYHTPLDAHAVDGGYMFILMYGSDSDWVKNVMASGHAELRINGEMIELTAPRLVPEDEAWRRLPKTTKPPAGFLNVTEFLQMAARS